MKGVQRAGVLLMLALLTSGVVRRLPGQISPGPLARPHASLEGTLKCTQCHGGGKEAMPGQCAACHKDVGWLAQRGRGFHGTTSVRGQSCASCHPDHAGVGFQLIKWPDGSAERFDHGRAGWELTQSHAKLQCSDCHAAKFQVGPSARLSVRKSPGGWTGLETTCRSCHEDVHRGALGTDCRKCHDAGEWKVTPGFQHDSTDYPLTNRHAEVSCAKCHEAARVATRRDAAGKPIPVFKPLPHGACTDCHTDPHAGRLGTTCTSCHTTRGFRQIDRQNFDHARTAYPLAGKHATVRCAACHQDFSTAALKKPKFGSCTSCHADSHNGTATLAGRVVDCAACHTVTGFRPASYTIAQHATTRYPLEGKHRAVECASCHRKVTTPAEVVRWGSARVVLHPVATTCRDCHADDHGGQFASRTDRGDCAACHAVNGWTPSRFDRDAHAGLRLPLEGRHAEVPCAACHAATRAGLPAIASGTTLGKAHQLFRIPEVACAQCHQDPHRGRFATARDSVPAVGCAGCHDARAFRPSVMTSSAHAAQGFPLDGAHRAVPCVSCHDQLKVARVRRAALVGQPPLGALALQARTACIDCHETPHGEQFAARKDGGRCESCHGTDRFQPASRFDHDRDASFPLRGAHEGVPCNRCHPTDTGSGDSRRLVYRPLSGKCESCHGGKEVR